jgi:hypothetical protein
MASTFGPMPELPVSTRLRPSDEHTACRREIMRLLIEHAQLAAELRDERQRFYDLKVSAELWIRLYERQLRRRGERS